jgi:hypothetical protein
MEPGLKNGIYAAAVFLLIGFVGSNIFLFAAVPTVKVMNGVKYLKILDFKEGYVYAKPVSVETTTILIYTVKE